MHEAISLVFWEGIPVVKIFVAFDLKYGNTKAVAQKITEAC
jgi:hypothetical protein